MMAIRMARRRARHGNQAREPLVATVYVSSMPVRIYEDRGHYFARLPGGGRTKNYESIAAAAHAGKTQLAVSTRHAAYAPDDILIEFVNDRYLVLPRNPRRSAFGGFKTKTEAVAFAHQVAHGRRVIDMTKKLRYAPRMKTRATAGWRVVVGGTKAAQARWPARTYQSKAAALRRRKQIHAAHDMGVSTIWILRA